MADQATYPLCHKEPERSKQNTSPLAHFMRILRFKAPGRGAKPHIPTRLLPLYGVWSNLAKTSSSQSVVEKISGKTSQTSQQESLQSLSDFFTLNPSEATRVHYIMVHYGIVFTV